MQGSRLIMGEKINCVVLLGPTAVGKTALGVSLAVEYGWEIISADSRQVYKGLDIGSGKDLADYTVTRKLPGDGSEKYTVPYHLIDVATLDTEYNVFDFQQQFYSIMNRNVAEGKMTFVVGGTGMYIDSVLRSYDFVPVPENAELRKELEEKSLGELDSMLLSMKPDLHNKSDLLLRDRVIRAIEIASFMKSPECDEARKKLEKRPDVNAFVIGTTLERDEMRSNIRKRLLERLDHGMIEEIAGLHDSGYSWERLEKLGLEYRFVSLYLEGKIGSLEEMTEQLYHSICQFAKRQETWFRGMERKGVKIHWLPRENDRNVKFSAASEMISAFVR